MVMDREFRYSADDLKSQFLAIPSPPISRNNFEHELGATALFATRPNNVPIQRLEKCLAHHASMSCIQATLIPPPKLQALSLEARTSRRTGQVDERIERHFTPMVGCRRTLINQRLLGPKQGWLCKL